MHVDKLIKMVIFYLSDGEKPRHKVTAKIRNYPKSDQSEAIKKLMSLGYVSIREDRTSGAGRTPSYISLTDKGRNKYLGYSEEPSRRSIWEV